ncbi:GIY-YIG nuclease family protein [bacterium]|nr:GIY-YIG nuclease family protein [bacterium]
MYVLQSQKDSYLYVGSTNNVERRLDEHNRGNMYSTKKHIPFKIVYYEAYLDRQDAIERENKLKHHGSVIGHLKKRLKNSLSKQPSQKGGV